MVRRRRREGVGRKGEREGKKSEEARKEGWRGVKVKIMGGKGNRKIRSV